MNGPPAQTPEPKRKHRTKNPWRRTCITWIKEPTQVVFESLGVSDKTNVKVWYLQTQKFSGIYITNEMISCMFDVPKYVLANILGVSDTFLKKHKDFFDYHCTLSNDDANATHYLLKRRTQLILSMSERGDSNSLKVLMEAELYSQDGLEPSTRPSWIDAKKKPPKVKKSKFQVETLQSEDRAKEESQMEDHQNKDEPVKAEWEPFLFEESDDIVLDYEIMDLEDIAASE